jgi:mRNA-degrading endonuclease toxin of MazEF toxin-antitoxin module
MIDWTSDLDYGVIIRATFGPRGQHKPKRPAVVAISREQIKKYGGLIVVVGSTDSIKPDIEVELPFGAAGKPHPLTGLEERTLISGDWQRVIRVTQVEDVCGEVPDGYMYLIESRLRGEPTMD